VSADFTQPGGLKESKPEVDPSAVALAEVEAQRRPPINSKKKPHPEGLPEYFSLAHAYDSSAASCGFGDPQMLLPLALILS
jgi:hypothetical protein